MSAVLDAIEKVLTETDEPLHYQDITQQIMEQGLWETEGKTPWISVNVAISLDIRDYDEHSRFKRVDRGVYALRKKTYPPEEDVTEEPEETIEEKLSFTDAAELILDEQDDKQPVQYRELMQRILDRRLLTTKSQSPEATLYASLYQEIQRYEKLSETPRFIIQHGGMIGLTKWLPKGLEGDIFNRNNRIRTELLKKLKKMDPAEFEKLIELLLVRMGFEEVETTSYRGDGGIDVRGTLVVGDVIRTKMAVQVKRWDQNIQANVVREVRGSLGAHEQGLVITTSDFGTGARTEAERSDAIPIGLMNGKQLVRLLVEYEVGIKRKPTEIFELTDISIQEINRE